MRRCLRGSEGICLYELYPRRGTQSGDVVSGGSGRSGAVRPCVPGDRCVRGRSGDGGTRLRAFASGGDGPSGLRSSRSAEAVSVRVPAPFAFIAAAGGGVPPQRGTDVAAGPAVSGPQVDRRV